MKNIGDFCWRDKNGVAHLSLPFSVVLSNGFTRTDPSQWSLDDEVMLDTGWTRSTLTVEDLNVLFPPSPPPPEPSLLEIGFATPSGWRLGWTPDDVALLTGLYVLAKESNELGINNRVVVTDTSGEKHELPFEEFKSIMLQYGAARATASASGLI
jgi:hypothetical protein